MFLSIFLRCEIAVKAVAYELQSCPSAQFCIGSNGIYTNPGGESGIPVGLAVITPAEAQGLSSESISGWYEKNESKMQLHPETREWIEAQL